MRGANLCERERKNCVLREQLTVSSKLLVMNEALHWAHKQNSVNQEFGRPDSRSQSVIAGWLVVSQRWLTV